MDDQNKPPNSDPTPLEPWIDPALEARIVALILGEASDFEKSELQSALDAQPELKAFHDRLLGTHNSVAQSQLPSSASDWKLPTAKRDALLEKFRTPAEAPSSATEAITHKTQKRRVIALAPWLGIAAAIMLLLAVVIPLTRRGTIFADAKHYEPELSGGVRSSIDLAEPTGAIAAKADPSVASAETTAEQILGESLYDTSLAAVNGATRQLETDWSGVIDGGYDSAIHPDIDRWYRFRRDADFVDGDEDGEPKDSQDNHGTQMAGVMIARHNSDGIAGIAQEADLDMDGFGIAAELNYSDSKVAFGEELPNLTGTRLFNSRGELAKNANGDSGADYDRGISHRLTIAAAAASEPTDPLGANQMRFGTFNTPGSGSAFGGGAGNALDHSLFADPGSARAVPVGPSPLTGGLRGGSVAIQTNSIDGIVSSTVTEDLKRAKDMPSVDKQFFAKATARKPAFAPPSTPVTEPAMEPNVSLFAKIDDGKKSSASSSSESDFGEIHILGNEKTQDHVISRGFATPPSEASTNTSPLETSAARLRLLPNFSRVAVTSADSYENGTDYRSIPVTEKPPGAVNFGLGFNSIDNLAGFVDPVQPQDQGLIGIGATDDDFASGLPFTATISTDFGYDSDSESLVSAREGKSGGNDAIAASESFHAAMPENEESFEDTKRPTIVAKSKKKSVDENAEPMSRSRSAGSGSNSIADREFARRLERVRQAQEEVIEGEELLAQGGSKAAIDKLSAALEKLPRAPLTQPDRDRATASLVDATVEQAHELALSGEFAEARTRLGFVLSDEIAPDNAEAKKILERLDDPEYYNPAVTPKHIEDVKQVERNLSLATAYADLGDFDKAEKEYNEVLRTDKYNETARRGMEEVETARQQYFKSSRDHTRGKMLSKVDELWEFALPSVDLGGRDGSNQNISDFTQISGNQVPNLSAPATSDDAPLIASQQSDLETSKGKRAWGAHGGVRLFSGDPSVTGRGGEVVLPAHRGRIFDANGELLAENVPTREVVADRDILGIVPAHGTPFNGNASAAKITGINSPDNWAYTTVRHWGLVNDGALLDGSGLDRPEVVVTGKSYWSDDESSKVNINVASEGAFWDIPRTDANSAGKKEELYRNPGHPSGVSLESIQFKTGLADAEQQLEQRLEESRETMLGLMEDSGIVDLGTETPQWAETELREERKSGVEYIAARDEYKRTKQQLSEIRGKIAESKPAAPKQKAAADLSLETLTSAEPFSTFSLNVSDVSFKLAKTALLDNGSYPDAAKVRIEEFVNAFDYGDPCPTPSQKVACQIDQAAHPFLQQRNLMRVSMRTAAEGRAASQPLRLTILLDKSGSMERADREESVLRTMQALAKHLGPADKITAIAFARQPHLITEGLTGDRAKELVNLVAATPSEGGTNLEEALKLADTLATRQFEDSATNRIVLITDGAANLGDADPESLKEKIIELRQRGIAFDACGVGADGFNDATLEALTRKGDGRYYFIDRPEDADENFVRQLAGALRPAAKNVKVQVKFNPERVTRYRLAGFEKHRLNKEDFRNDKVDAAEMAAAEAGNAVYQFEADPQGEGDVGEVFVRFLDTNTNEMVERSWSIPYQPKAPRLEEAKPSMQIAATAAFLAEKLKGDPASATIQLEELSQITNQLRTNQDPRVQALIQMVEKARSLK